MAQSPISNQIWERHAQSHEDEYRNQVNKYVLSIRGLRALRRAVNARWDHDTNLRKRVETLYRKYPAQLGRARAQVAESTRSSYVAAGQGKSRGQWRSQAEVTLFLILLERMIWDKYKKSGRVLVAAQQRTKRLRLARQAAAQTSEFAQSCMQKMKPLPSPSPLAHSWTMGEGNSTAVIPSSYALQASRVEFHRAGVDDGGAAMADKMAALRLQEF